MFFARSASFFDNSVEARYRGSSRETLDIDRVVIRFA